MGPPNLHTIEPVTVSGTTTDRELSMFEICAKLLEARWRLVRWALAGGAIAAITVMGKPPQYHASASFAPQGLTDASRNGLASLAGQFGVSIPGSSQALTPEYYVELLRSRALLSRVANDTFTVPELGGRAVSFYDLFQLKAPNQLQREDKAVALLDAVVDAAVSKATGMVNVTAATKWRSVSLSIVSALIEGVNDFNQHAQQHQAETERKFIEGRLAIADRELTAAEDRLDQFYKGNRVFSGSPDLATQRDRLQRAVNQRQQVYNTLAQSYEETRLREVRNTPVITVVEAPSAPALPDPRGRAKVTLLGIIAGGFLAVFMVLFKDLMRRRLAAGDPDAFAFHGQVAALRFDLVHPGNWIRELFGRSNRK